MANTSIFAAFERMWHHVVALASGKANAEHEHDNYIPVDEKGAPNGVATLNESGTIPSSQLPSYVDDVLEFAARASFPVTGESGKIYVDTTANVTYRWSGSTYTEISKSLAIGTTDSTAAAGNHSHNLSELANDSGFTTKQYVDNAIENLPTASTSAYGVTKLSSSTSSTSTTLAATPSAVKSAYDLANNATPMIVTLWGNDTTFSAIKSAANQGKVVLGKYSPDVGDDPYIFTLSQITDTVATFTGVYENEIHTIQYHYNFDTNIGMDLSYWGSLNTYSLVNKAGDTMTGVLTLAGDPTEDLHAATKQYVDNKTANIDLSTKVSKSGDTMTGPIEFSGTSNAIDFDTSGWIRGKTTSGSRYDIFGYSNPTTLQVGGTYPALALKGKDTRPTYNNAEMALLSDIESNIFIAEYGVTTYEELEAAYNAGKVLICNYGNSVYTLALADSTVGYVFNSGITTAYQYVMYNLALNMWINDSYGRVLTQYGVLTNKLVAQSNTNYTTKQVRNIILVADGEEIPAGANGDICLVYAP